MSLTNDDMIDGLPRRPRIADATGSAILFAIAGGLLAGPLDALVGGAAGNAVANQRQPLEMAIREHFRQLGWELIFFYPAPRAVKVTFRYAPSAYWTVESVMPDDFSPIPEDIADWLYGNLINVELPKAQFEIQDLLRRKRAS